jgi:hypothetical protein
VRDWKTRYQAMCSNGTEDRGVTLRVKQIQTTRDLITIIFETCSRRECRESPENLTALGLSILVLIISRPQRRRKAASHMI